MVMNNVQICHSWRELEDSSYECVCPGCGYISTYIGLEPFSCAACEVEFVLDEERKIYIRPCGNCIHYTFAGDMNIPDVCLECMRDESNSKFQAKDDIDNEWETLPDGDFDENLY